MLTLSKIIFKYVSSYFLKMCLAIWMCLLAHPTEEPCESEKRLSALLQLGRAESAELLDSDVLALRLVLSCSNCSSAFMASVDIAESKESISQNSPCDSPMEWQNCSIVMWEFMDITIAYLDAQAFIIGSLSGKFTLGSGCSWVWWGHMHYLSTESHFTLKITRWFYCSCFIAMVGFSEVECGLIGPFWLETSCLPLCSVGAEETPVSGLSHLHRKDVFLWTGDFSVKMSAYLFLLSLFLIPNFGDMMSTSCSLHKVSSGPQALLPWGKGGPFSITHRKP